MTVNFREELEEMRRRYAQSPETETLLPPYYLSISDELRRFFREYRTLYEKGNVYYGSVVQANKLLFSYLPQTNHPAAMIFSKDTITESNPFILEAMAHELFRYGYDYTVSVPNELKAVAASLRDETDRTSAQFTSDEYGIEVLFRCVIVFKRSLPRRRLKSSILPVLAADCTESIMILPKKYWSDNFVKMYNKGLL